MRKKIVAGNWKMHLKQDEAVALVKGIVQQQESLPEEVEMVLFPAFPFLTVVKEIIADRPIRLGAQNVNANERGAFTGEVSTEMLVSVGATHVLVGHSERRAYYQEDDTVLKAKVDRVLHEGMVVVYCCGETLEEREAGNHFEVVLNQLKASLFHVQPTFMKNCIVAYEPVWAIGTGKTASAEEAQEMHAFIRAEVAKQFDAGVADDLSILYGGSCKPANASELFSKPDIDGGLIGGASLNADDFTAIVASFS